MNFVWQGHPFTYVRAKRSAKSSYFVKCPLSKDQHKCPLSSKTFCTRRRSFRENSEAERDAVVVALKAWLLAPEHEKLPTRSEHMGWEPNSGQLKHVAALDAGACAVPEVPAGSPKASSKRAAAKATAAIAKSASKIKRGRTKTVWK